MMQPGMQQTPLPIVMQPVIDLSTVGVNAASFRVGNLTMESDKYISVKDSAQDGSGQVIVIDMANNNAVNKRPMKAEATLMSLSDNVIALKGKNDGQATGHFVQVFNLDTKEKLGVYQSPENIVFWKWIGNRRLALISDKSVYHW